MAALTEPSDDPLRRCAPRCRRCRHPYIEFDRHSRETAKEPPVAETNRPRVEPEIIPPSHADPRWDERMRIDGRSSQRIYVAQVGPFGFAMAALAVAIIAALASCWCSGHLWF